MTWTYAEAEMKKTTLESLRKNTSRLQVLIIQLPALSVQPSNKVQLRLHRKPKVERKGG